MNNEGARHAPEVVEVEFMRLVDRDHHGWKLGGALAVICAVLAIGTSSMRAATSGNGYVANGVERLRAYVEEVFRRQNRMGDLLIEIETADRDIGAANLVKLAAAEDRMRDACLSLNRGAATVADGESVGLGLGVAILWDVARCESATRQLEANLATVLPPDTATVSY